MTNKILNIRSRNFTFVKAIILSKPSESHQIDCFNNGTVGKEVNCSIPIAYSNIKSASNAYFPYSLFNLSGFVTNLGLDINFIYNISGYIFDINVNKSVPLKSTATWSFNNNVTQKNLSGDTGNSFRSIFLPSYTCLKSQADIYNITLNLTYSTFIRTEITEMGVMVQPSELLIQIRNILNNNNVNIVNGIPDVTFQSSILLNTVLVDIKYPDIYECVSNATQQTTPKPIVDGQQRILLKPLSFIPTQRFIQKIYYTIPNQVEWRQAYQDISYPLLFRSSNDHQVFGFFFFWAGWIDHVYYDYVNPDKDEEIAKEIRKKKFITDIYKITTYGKFDKRHPDAIQLVVNDIKGVKIYSLDGDLLFEKSDFCNFPFVYGAHVSEHEYRARGLIYRVSFDYYNNHDLSQGGVRIGDFDGDGTYDLMCYYPSTTKDFASRISNQIIFSSLHINTTLPILTSNRYRCDTNSDFPVSHWCSDGTSKVGDFNGDNSDYVICITQNAGGITGSMYYGNSGAFIYAPPITLKVSINTVIPISILSLIDNHVINKVIVGDFDGDRHSDLIFVESFSGFYKFTFGTDEWFSFNQEYSISGTSAALSICDGTDTNRIIVEDFNKDGIDEIYCINSEGAVAVLTVIHGRPRYNTVSGQNTVRRLLQDETTQDSINIVVPPVQPKIYVNPLKQISIVVSDVSIDTNVNLEASHKKIATQSFIKNNVYSNTKNNLEANTELRTVKKVYFPLENLKLDDNIANISFTFSDSYTIPDNIDLDYNILQKSIQIRINVNAKWSVSEGEIVSTTLESNTANTFLMSSFAAPASCLHNNLENNYATIRLSYTAEARMYIESEETREIVIEEAENTRLLSENNTPLDTRTEIALTEPVHNEEIQFDSPGDIRTSKKTAPRASINIRSYTVNKSPSTTSPQTQNQCAAETLTYARSTLWVPGSSTKVKTIKALGFSDTAKHITYLSYYDDHIDIVQSISGTARVVNSKKYINSLDLYKTSTNNFYTAYSYYNITDFTYEYNLFSNNDNKAQIFKIPKEHKGLFVSDISGAHIITASMTNSTHMQLRKLEPNNPNQSNFQDLKIQTCLGYPTLIKLKATNSFFVLVYGSPANQVINIECRSTADGSLTGSNQILNQKFSKIILDMYSTATSTNFAVAWQNTYTSDIDILDPAKLRKYDSSCSQIGAEITLSSKISTREELHSIKVIDNSYLINAFAMSRYVLIKAFKENSEWRSSLNLNSQSSGKINDLDITYISQFRENTPNQHCERTDIYVAYSTELFGQSNIWEDQYQLTRDME